MVSSSRRPTTIPDGICVWILLISVVLTLIMTNCNAQTLEDKRLPQNLEQYDNRQLSPRDLAWALYQTGSRVRRGHRHMTDAGYGSRVQAASKIASALTAHHDLFGSFGPGRRKRPSPSENDVTSDVIRRLLQYGADVSQES